MGYHSSGNELLYDGMSGKQIESEIFIGPTYYMRLKHMVKDKINYRARGPTTALTRQPVSGRANDGGLRIGEMERDSLVSHGMVDFVTESMMERGDKYKVAVCNTTGLFAIYNPSKNLFLSPMADGPIRFLGSLDGKELNIDNVTHFGRDFSVINVPYSLKLLIQELQAINVQMRIITEDNIDQMESMANSRNIEKTSGITDINEVRKLFNKMARRENVLQEMNDEITPDAQSPPPGFEPTTPDYRTPTYEDTPSWSSSTDSVPYAPTSPMYAPDVAPDYAATSPTYQPTSPTYQPTSPTYQPTSPTYAPDLAQDVSPPYAPEFNVGEKVLLRGGSHTPTTNWDVVKIGTNLITLRGPNGEIEIAQKGDLYRPSDIIQAPMQIANDMQYQNQLIQQEMNPIQYQQQQPGINIAPVFNFGTINPPEVIKCEPEPTKVVKIDGGSSGEVVKSQEDGAIDFNRLIIKKV
jgi:hypothetical protein